MLCIHNNASINNESVRICRVLRASLNILQFLHHSGSFQNRRTGCDIFPFAGVSDCFVCWTAYDEQNFRVFCQKRISYTGIFKVWCLGNNLCEKYAFTFIQHSRSTFWLISTEAYNPEASKFPLLLRRFDGNDPSYKMGRVVLFWHKSPSRAFSAYARYKSMLRKIGQSSKPEHRAHGCLRHLYSVTIKDGEQTVQFRQRLTNSSEWTLILEVVSSQRNLNRVFLNSDQLKSLLKILAFSLLALL